jgi:hypothetical protein
MQTNNKSGLKGVSSRRGRWRAQIGFHGASLHIGTFASPEAAYAAYVAKAAELFGDFARAA